MREARPDDIGVSVSYPLPGTKFYRAVQAELGTKRNWVDSADLAMMFRGPYTTGFYRRLHTVLHREFRLRRVVRELRPAVAGRGAYAGGSWHTRRLRSATRPPCRSSALG